MQNSVWVLMMAGFVQNGNDGRHILFSNRFECLTFQEEVNERFVQCATARTRGRLVLGGVAAVDRVSLGHYPGMGGSSEHFQWICSD